MDNTMGRCSTMVPRIGWTHRYGLLQQGYHGQYHGTLLYHGTQDRMDTQVWVVTAGVSWTIPWDVAVPWYQG